MPPLTLQEKREAAAYLTGSGTKQRISEAAIATEVARRRIACGQYGKVTPDDSRVKEASADLGLSKRQQKELRQKLREPLPVRTLESFFAQVEQHAGEPMDTAGSIGDSERLAQSACTATGCTCSKEQTGEGCSICRMLENGEHDDAAAEFLKEMVVSVEMTGNREPDETGWLRTEDAEIKIKWPYNGCTFSPPFRYTGPVPGDGELGSAPPEWDALFKQLERFIADLLLTDETECEMEEQLEHERLERERLEREQLERKRMAQSDEAQRAQRQRDQAKHAQRVAHREFEVNSTAITSLGLPLLNLLIQHLPTAVLPAWLTEAFASGLVLQARIVDFWRGSAAYRRALCTWLERLGFDVTVTDDLLQIGVSCGYVVARATGIMYAAGHEWRVADVSDAVEERWISLAGQRVAREWLAFRRLPRDAACVHVSATVSRACLEPAASAMQ